MVNYKEQIAKILADAEIGLPQEEIMEVIDRTLEGKHVFPDKAPAVELKWMKSDEISVAWFLEGERLEGENSLVLTHKPKPGVMRYDALLYHQYKGSIGSITINYTMPYYAE